MTVDRAKSKYVVLPMSQHEGLPPVHVQKAFTAFSLGSKNCAQNTNDCVLIKSVVTFFLPETTEGDQQCAKMKGHHMPASLFIFPDLIFHPQQ